MQAAGPSAAGATAAAFHAVALAGHNYHDTAGRFRACEMGPDGNLYVALEDQGKIFRVKPE